MKKIYIFALAFLLIACNNTGKFTVSGTISEAKDQTLYFEHAGLVKDSLIDSVKLSENGNFKFHSKRPAYPDLYKLRVGNQQLILGIDSTEEISIKASANNLLNAQITNSTSSTDIQTLRKSVFNMQNLALSIGNEKDAVKQKARIDSFNTSLENHKKSVLDLILRNPRSMAAYFALYQQINGQYIINPYIREDRKYFSAVATSFDAYMPDYQRSINLHNLVIDALKQTKADEQQQLLSQLQQTHGINYPEIELKDNKGAVRKLSDFQGKTIVLDFSAVSMNNFVDYTFDLRDIYNAYSGRGLQIYQVSLDDNKMLWERGVANLPWICVRDNNGSASRYISVYNVQNIPTLFLIDKKGAIVGRYNDFESLKAAIKRVI